MKTIICKKCGCLIEIESDMKIDIKICSKCEGK